MNALISVLLASILKWSYSGLSIAYFDLKMVSLTK